MGLSAGNTDPDADSGFSRSGERNYGWRISDKSHTMDPRTE